MSPALERYALRVMSGEARGLVPALLRGALYAAEPVYAGAMAARNRLYDAGRFEIHRLPRPVISVGNLTAGGTGKTPAVRWLAERLLSRGHHPAVLLRGYRAGSDAMSDEQQLLHAYLNGRPDGTVAVVANPDRVAGAAVALERQPRTDVFLLDDAFQHRRVARDFDLVLISAADPFGFGHVHPRGLLREPRRGLRRADAVVLTRCDAVDAAELIAIERRIREIDGLVPVFRTVHRMTGLRRSATPADTPIDEPLDALRGRRFFSFSGIGSPRTFHDHLVRAGGQPVGTRAFPDHHDYTDADVAALAREGGAAGAELLLTTEKDWVKLSRLPEASNVQPQILRVEVELAFPEAGENDRLLEMIVRRIAPRAADDSGP